MIIFSKQDNLHYLPDAIIKIDNLRKNIPDNFDLIKNKRIILSTDLILKNFLIYK